MSTHVKRCYVCDLRALVTPSSGRLSWPACAAPRRTGSSPADPPGPGHQPSRAVLDTGITTSPLLTTPAPPHLACRAGRGAPAAPAPRPREVPRHHQGPGVPWAPPCPRRGARGRPARRGLPWARTCRWARADPAARGTLSVPSLPGCRGHLHSSAVLL